MGRRRLTREEMVRSGAAEKHPERMEGRVSEAKAQGPLGPPPEKFLRPHSSTAAYELAAWHELIAMVPPGVLTSAHRWWCERASVLMAKARYSTLKSGEEGKLKEYMAAMGCSPGKAPTINVAPGAGVGAAIGASVKDGDSNGKPGSAFHEIAKEAAAKRPN